MEWYLNGFAVVVTGKSGDAFVEVIVEYQRTESREFVIFKMGLKQ